MPTEREDPWVRAKSGAPGPCHYGCGMQATLTEPGKPWKAHKVCAQREEMGTYAGYSWDGEDHKPTPDRPYGCGGDSAPIVSGRRCAGAGTILACQLCPHSPTYWGGQP